MINPKQIARLITEDPDIPDEYEGLEDNDEFGETTWFDCSGCHIQVPVVDYAAFRQVHNNNAFGFNNLTFCKCGSLWCENCVAVAKSPEFELDTRPDESSRATFSKCPECVTNSRYSNELPFTGLPIGPNDYGVTESVDEYAGLEDNDEFETEEDDFCDGCSRYFDHDLDLCRCDGMV